MAGTRSCMLPRFGLAVLLVASACSDDPTRPGPTTRPSFSFTSTELLPIADPSGGLETFLIAVNQQLALQGAPFAVREASMLFAAAGFDPERASIVIANDRVHRFAYRFVGGDPRRGTVGNIIRQASFLPFAVAPTGSGFIAAKPSIDASFATWSALQCANLPIVNNLLPPAVFPSAILNLAGVVENPLLSDVNTVGFLPGGIFNLVLGPGAATQVLGVTFPFVWVDGNGNPTDIDNDGNDDAAFAEIWYNADFRWTNTGTGANVDIETVSLHENGHALGLGHFGLIQINLSSGKLQVAPRAVMNAVVLGTLRSPRGVDNASFCGQWDEWP